MYLNLPGHTSHLLVIKEGDKPFDKEIKIRDNLETILKGSVKLPKKVDHFEHGGKFYYLMGMEEGDTLSDLIKFPPIH